VLQELIVSLFLRVFFKLPPLQLVEEVVVEQVVD
jgi:hypothetical protein